MSLKMNLDKKFISTCDCLDNCDCPMISLTEMKNILCSWSELNQLLEEDAINRAAYESKKNG